MPPKTPNSVDTLTLQHEVFKLAHLSDPHLIASNDVKVRDLLNKRAYGYLSWHLHRHTEHRAQILGALVKDVQSANPDHIAFTGDLTHLGLPREFRKARELLQALGPPSKVTVVPGNHDAYVATEWKDTFRLWSDYMASDSGHARTAPQEDPRAVFPIIRVRGHLALIGVCTAHPTPPFFATGSIGEGQLDKLGEILAETRQRGLVRVLLLHHPPVPGAVSWRNRLTDRRAFQTLLAQHGAELILHGHTHSIVQGYLETPSGTVFSIGVSSASALGRTQRRRARYHLFRLAHNADTFHMALIVRVYSPKEDSFVTEEVRQIPMPSNSSRIAECL